MEDGKKDFDLGVGSDNGDKWLFVIEFFDEDIVSFNVLMLNIMEEE